MIKIMASLAPEQMKDEIMNTIEEVRSMKMEDRPRLIKLVENKNFKTPLHSVNGVVDELFPGELTITELNVVSFGTALFIQRKHAPWYKEKRQPGRRKKNREFDQWFTLKVFATSIIVNL